MKNPFAAACSLLLFFAGLALPLLAQTPFACGHDALLETALADSAFAQKQTALDRRWQLAPRPLKGEPFGANSPFRGHGGKPALQTIPVAVHILHDDGPENIPDAQVFAAIQYLNEAFANADWFDQNTGAAVGIQFCLATRTPDGNPTNGITRDRTALTELVAETQDLAAKGIRRWEPRRYLNIWVVRSICFQSLGCGVAAYATGPTFHGTGVDGVVIEHPFFGASPGLTAALAHEVGHYFGLYHTFAGGCKNDNCLTDGDQICDTPPDQSTAPLPCDLTANTCTTDSKSGFSSDQPDATTNFLDYGNLLCQHDFTAGQAARMVFFLENERQSLLTSDGCGQPCLNPVVADFSPGDTLVQVGTSLVFQNQSQAASTFIWQQNGQPFSTENSPELTFPNEGVFTISLTATAANSALCPPQTATAVVQVACPVVADFQADRLDVSIGETVVFTNLSQNFTGISWTVGGQPQGADLPSFTFSAAGVFPVVLTATNGLCSRSKRLSVFVRDSCREKTWRLTFGTPDNDEAGRATTGLSDGSLLLGGDGAVPGAGREVLLLKANANGGPIWTQRFGSPATDEFLTDLAATPDGGFVAAFVADGQPALARFSAAGTVVWQKKFEATGQIRHLRPAPDGGFTLAGWLADGQDTTAFFGKIAANGGLFWAKNWRTPGPIFGQDMIQLVGIGYLAGGYFSEGGKRHGFGARFDDTGNVLAVRRFDGTPFHAVSIDLDIYIFAGSIDYITNFGQPVYPVSCGYAASVSATNFFQNPVPAAFVSDVAACSPSGVDAAFHDIAKMPDGQICLPLNQIGAGGAPEIPTLLMGFPTDIPAGNWTVGQYPLPGGGRAWDVDMVGEAPVIAGRAGGDIFWAKANRQGLAGACPQGTASVVAYTTPPVSPASMSLVPAVSPVFSPINLTMQPYFLGKNAPCPAECAEAFCKTAFVKYMGRTNQREGLTSITAAPDGTFFCAGFKNDSTVLLQIAQDGTVLWAQVFRFSKPSDRVTDLLLDSEGQLVGVGQATVNSVSASSFAFRYDPAAGMVKWSTETPSGQNVRFHSVAEATPGGAYRIHLTQRSGQLPNPTSEPEWIEINRETGLPTAGDLPKKYLAPSQSSSPFDKIRHTGGAWYGFGQLSDTPVAGISARAILSKISDNGQILWSLIGGTAPVVWQTQVLDVAGSGDSLFVVLKYRKDDPNTPFSGQQLLLCLSAADGTVRWSKGMQIGTLNGSTLLGRQVREILARPDALYFACTEEDGKGLALLKTNRRGEPLWGRLLSADFAANAASRTMAEIDNSVFMVGSGLTSLGDMAFLRLNATTGETGDSDCSQPLFADTVSLPFRFDPIGLQVATTSAALAPRTVLPFSYKTGPETFPCAAPCAEICGNGQSDDYDGRPDCFDTECTCLDCAGKSGSIWYFGINAGLSFNTDPPTILTDGQTQQNGATAVASDPEGNLLFYTTGERIFDRNHQVMPNGLAVGGQLAGSACLAFPIKGLDEYAVITQSGGNVSPQVFYTKVDMTRRGFLGDVDVATKKVPLSPDWPAFKIAATNCESGTWLIMNMADSNAWESRYFTNGTVSPAYRSYGGTSVLQGTLTDNSAGQLKFSGDGQTLVNTLPGSGGIEIFDFDDVDGKISNPRTILLPDLAGAVGLEFSPNNRFLYVATRKPPSRVWQFDMLAGDAAAIANSRVLLAESPVFGQFSLLQLAPNGKIYISQNPNNASTGSLHVIHKPDQRGPDCRLQISGQSLGAGKAFFGLPSFVRQAVWPKEQVEIVGPDSICGVPGRVFFELRGSSCLSWDIWGVTGVASTITPAVRGLDVVFESPGTAFVNVTLNTPCGPVRDTLRVRVLNTSAPTLELGPDVVLCENGVATLAATPGFSRYLWNDGTTGPSLTTLFSGTYSVIAWDACGNPQTDSVQVSISPGSQLALGDDLKICRTDGAVFVRPTNFSTWKWSPGQPIADCDTCATVRLFPQKTTEFTVVGQSADGCLSTDTVRIALDTAFAKLDTFVCENVRLPFLGASLPADTTARFAMPPANGCDSILEVTTLPLPGLSFSLPPDTTLKIGDTLLLNIAPDGPAPFDFVWKIDPASGGQLSCADCPDPEFFALRNSILSLQVKASNGCAASDSLTIKVLDVCQVNAPTAFTPNGDGTNDTFFLLADPCVRRVVSLRIFTRWGEAVFLRTDLPPNTRSLGWDGRDAAGRDLPSDVLVWWAEVELFDGRRRVEKGELTLLR